MDKLKNIEKIADLILICGDIGGKNTINKTFQQFSDYQLQGAEYLENVLKELSIPREKIENQILTLKSNEIAILSSEKLQECINSWDSYPFEKKKEIAKLFIKVITITDNELQIIFN